MSRRIRLIVLAAVAAATAIALARSDPRAIGRALAAMSWRWAALAAVINLAGVMIDAFRLRVIVGALRPVAFWSVVEAQLAGIVGNVLFPLKLGEGARAYALTQRHNLPAATALTTVVIDRVIDAVSLPAFVMIASLVLPLPPAIAQYRQWGLLLMAAAGVAAVAIGRRLRASRAEAVQTSTHRVGAIDRIIAGMAVLGRRRRVASTIGVSLASWSARTAIVYCMLRAFGFVLPLSAAVSILVVINLGIAAVATPANAGAFELAAAAGLGLWGAPFDKGLSFGIGMHIVEVAPPLLLGCWTAWRSWRTPSGSNGTPEVTIVDGGRGAAWVNR